MTTHPKRGTEGARNLRGRRRTNIFFSFFFYRRRSRLQMGAEGAAPPEGERNPAEGGCFASIDNLDKSFPDNGVQKLSQTTTPDEPKKNIKEEVRPKKKIEYYRLKNTEDYMSICKRVTATRQSIDLVEKYLATMQNEMKRCRKKKR